MSLGARKPPAHARVEAITPLGTEPQVSTWPHSPGCAVSPRKPRGRDRRRSAGGYHKSHLCALYQRGAGSLSMGAHTPSWKPGFLKSPAHLSVWVWGASSRGWAYGDSRRSKATLAAATLLSAETLEAAKERGPIGLARVGAWSGAGESSRREAPRHAPGPSLLRAEPAAAPQPRFSAWCLFNPPPLGCSCGHRDPGRADPGAGPLLLPPGAPLPPQTSGPKVPGSRRACHLNGPGVR